MSDEPAPSSETGPDHPARPLDDVLLAMDVVDTLRHRQQLVARELDSEGREEQLIERLREIYLAQGIEVPDGILRDGVKALEEQRFVYTPPRPGLGVSLAKIYVSRDRWLKPLLAGIVALAAIWAVWHFAVVGPSQRAAERARVELAETLPNRAGALRDEIVAATDDPAALDKAAALYALALSEAGAGDRKDTVRAVEALEALKADLARVYEVRVVYGPGEPYSGVFRIPDDAPATRNYYLIVEAVDATGRPVEVEIESQEDRKTERASRWGQRVTKEAFDAVAADKSDDQIIENAVVGRKRAGRLEPDWSIDTPGGAILEW